jgi:hypothetical protein
MSPVQDGPLHALGYCFPDTYHTSLADLLSDVSQVTVQKHVTEKGQSEWLVYVKSLPARVCPHDWSDHQRSHARVRIWIATEPEFLLKRWAVYLPRVGAAEYDSVFGQSIPSLDFVGHNLLCGYVNSYEGPPVRDELRDRHIRMPLRVLCGNGNGNRENRIEAVTVNPRPSAKTFSPDLPAGYSIARSNEDNERQVSVVGGQEGTAVRVRDITQQARAMLASGDSLRASPDAFSQWAFPIGCIVLVLAGSALVFLSRRKKA